MLSRGGKELIRGGTILIRGCRKALLHEKALRESPL